MAQADKHDEAVQPDEATQLKKRARRRLIGAAALALLAAIVLPMVMDHQPAPLLKDVQVRIPSPDEGVTQRVTPKSAPSGASAQAVVKAVDKAEIKPIAKTDPKPESKPEPKAEAKPEPNTDIKPESKPEAKPETRAEPKPESKSDPTVAEAWEIQLGAYQEPGRVKNLLAKLKEVGVPTYTERVDTPNGVRTRVRAGPFPSQEAAEKARARVKIVGVDGPVARKP